MEQNKLKSASFISILNSFKEWLSIIGYSEKTVHGLPNCVREMLLFQEKKGLYKTDHLNAKCIERYYKHLKKRPNKRNGQLLNNNTLNKHLQAINKFNDYLFQTGKVSTLMQRIPNEDKVKPKVCVLSIDEINSLYKASYLHNYNTKSKLIGARDRALLSIFYGCGVRRNEGYHLNINDIYFEKKMIHVRKGKNYSERLIPFNSANSIILSEYIMDARPLLCKNECEKAFFISVRSNRMKGESLLTRLKELVRLTGDKQMAEKEIGLHTLRHSIATHLLDGGMNLKNIAKFLGHRSIEATQIYTHLSILNNGTL